MLDLMKNLIDIFGNFGYGGIVFLMALESSIFPLPSELVMPPAGYLAERGELNLLLVILAGTLGSVLGAAASYGIAYWLGKIFVYRLSDHRLAKMIFINSQKVKKAEDFFLKYGSVSVFTGRLLPVVRHLISLPAGFCRMPFGKFILYTAIGSFIWVSILAVAGFYLGRQAILLAEYYKEAALLLIAAVGCGFLVYLIGKKIAAGRK